jgi:hypothetical protein
MSGAEQTTVIAGLDGRHEASCPDWFAAQHPDAEPVTFTQAIRDLPRATTTDVVYRNPYSGEWTATDQHVALVEPSRLVSEAEDGEPERDPLFHVPTDSYAVLNPTDVFGPVTDLLAETEIDGHLLGDILFGEIRQYRGGGEVHMDLMFDGLQADLPDRNDPITMGVTPATTSSAGTRCTSRGSRGIRPVRTRFAPSPSVKPSGTSATSTTCVTGGRRASSSWTCWPRTCWTVSPPPKT